MVDFPLPLAWTVPFAWDCALWDAPVVRGDEVIVRAGSRLVGLDAGRGEVRWQLDLPGANLGGQVFDVAGDVLIADVVIDRDQRLVGATRERVAWQLPLGGTTVRGGAAVRGSECVAIVASRREVVLVRVDPGTGDEIRARLPAGGATLAFAGADIIVMSPTANAGAPGAYLLAGDGRPARVLRTDDVWSGVVSGPHLLSVGDRKQSRHTVDVREIASGEVRWSDECFGDVGALEGDDAVYAMRLGESTELVMRSAASGTIRWRSNLGDVKPVVISTVASVILVSHMRGMMVVRRDDGCVLGDAPGVEGFRGTVAGGLLYLGGDRELLAARLPGSGA
jgi:outer membrane protein assembly factor BamB